MAQAMAALIGWLIVGHLMAWMLALPVTSVGPGAGLMSVLLGLYVGVRDRRRVLAGLCVALLTLGVTLLVLRESVLEGFPEHQRIALQEAVVSILFGFLTGLLVIRRSRMKAGTGRSHG